MLDQLVGQFMQSGAGADVLSQLKEKGLDGNQAQGAITATAEGAMQQMGGSAGGLGAMLGGASGLGGMLGSLTGAASGATGAAGGALSGMIQPVANFVAQKTGMQPAMATMVVSVALPKLLELIQGKGAPAEGDAPASGGLGGLAGKLGGLF